MIQQLLVSRWVNGRMEISTDDSGVPPIPADIPIEFVERRLENLYQYIAVEITQDSDSKTTYTFTVTFDCTGDERRDTADPDSGERAENNAD